MREIDKIIMAAREANASDIHITKGLYLLYRVKGTLVHAPMQPTPEETEEMLYGLLDEGQKKRLDEGYDIDFAIQTEDGNRQRVNVFRTQKRIAATIRLLNSYIPTLEELNLPDQLYKLAQEPRGLILVTGPTGSGKSTTCLHD